MKKINILITNDDGIHAKGLSELSKIAQRFGNIIVVAPHMPRSGMSSAITIEQPIRLNLFEKREGYISYSCTGTPVDCVKIAYDQLMETPPDLILSGINHGTNSSVSIHYSGTMGAVIEGCIHEIPSIGFSLCDHHPNADFSEASENISKIIEKVIEKGLPLGTCLNVNIPKGIPKGIEICRQGHGRWVEEFEQRIDPHKQPYYWITGYYKNLSNGSIDTDNHMLDENKISIVPTTIDLTNHKFIEEMKTWDI